ncbi:MAG TPA: Ig domain-containing protein [Candidatus Caccocola faecigallinarum]|nr:Ig domain-containing protein [Candidatus Caccocola faecigallinarum]
MKATKQATPGTSGRSAPARGKFGKICLVLLLLATAVFCGFAPRAWAEPVGCWTDVGNYDISWYTDNPEAEEYDLMDAADLAGLAYLVNNNIEFFNSSKSNNGKIVRLRAPVDMSAHYWEPIGTFRVNGITDVSPCFFGTFDGGNHAISGIVVQNDGTDKSVYAGFFGYIEWDSKNPNFDFDVYRFPRLLSINIVNAYIEGADKVMEYSVPTSPNPLKVEPIAAGIVAYADAGTIGTEIYDCTFSGFVSGYDAAGIVGKNNTGGAVSCVNMGGVSAERYAGGIVARMEDGSNIEQCTNEGPVASKFAAGGIAGLHGNSGDGPGAISYCSSTGPVYGKPHSGAIAGYTKGTQTGFTYKTNYYWLNETSADVFPSGQVGNAKTSLGGSEEELTTAPVEANKVDTLAKMPPTTVIFDYAKAPYGRREDRKTAYNYSPYHYVYPDDDGVYTLGPITIYPTGSATAGDIIIGPEGNYALSRTNLTKEEYSKQFSLCVTSGSVGNDINIRYVRAKDDDRMNYANTLIRKFKPYLRLEKIVKAPTAITLSDATLKTGETAVLTAVFDPDTTPQSARGLKWSSDNESVATVDASGKVTAVGVGQARITATSEVFEEASPAECVVTVNKNDVQIEGVALNETAVEVKPGDKLQLSASVLPEGSPQGVTWSSSNAEVASVDEAGLVTAIAEGTAVVTATSSADSSKSASCTITVTASAPLPVVVTADCVTQDPGSLKALTEQLPDGVDVVTSVSPESETNALETLAAGGHTGTPNIEGIDRTEPGAVNALTSFTLDVQHDAAADGDLTMTINLSASINVAEGSSLYAFIPYRDAPKKFGSFVCTPANGANITSVTFTVKSYARFFSEAPVILASVKDSAPQPAPSGGGGGGGCSAGFGALALLAAVPLLARRKK